MEDRSQASIAPSTAKRQKTKKQISFDTTQPVSPNKHKPEDGRSPSPSILMHTENQMAQMELENNTLLTAD